MGRRPIAEQGQGSDAWPRLEYQSEMELHDRASIPGGRDPGNREADDSAHLEGSEVEQPDHQRVSRGRRLQYGNARISVFASRKLMWGATKRHAFANMTDSSISACPCFCVERKDRADRSLEVCAEMKIARSEILYAHALHMWMTTSLGSSHQAVNARAHAWCMGDPVEGARVVLIVGRTRFLRRASVWRV